MSLLSDFISKAIGLVSPRNEDDDEPIPSADLQPQVNNLEATVLDKDIDAATSNDAEPRFGVSQLDDIPGDMLVAADALGYTWTDQTNSVEGNRVLGYPTQGGVPLSDLKAKKKEHDPKNLSLLRRALNLFLSEEDEEDVDKSKSEWTKTAKIFKAEAQKQVAYCVVLEPDTIDAQEDYMTAADIEETAHNYMIKSRTIGKSHEVAIDAKPVESYLAPQDLIFHDGPFGPQTVKKGSWVIGIKVLDPGEWEKVASGEYTGVSVAGYGVRS